MVGISNESVPEIAIDQKNPRNIPKVDHFAARYGNVMINSKDGDRWFASKHDDFYIAMFEYWRLSITKFNPMKSP